MSVDDPIYMDLGDFVPESYTIRFAIADREYMFDFAEATVHEVLTLMARQSQSDDFIASAHSTVFSFLKKHITSGDVGRLEQDLKSVPYRSKRGTLDLEGILNALNKRFRKKTPWGEQKKSEQPCVWFMRQIAFLMHASSGALAHDIIMSLSWRQFGVYLDSFTWLIREQTEKGHAQNAKDDLISMSNNPLVKAKKEQMIEETKSRVAKLRNRSVKRTSITRSLLK